MSREPPQRDGGSRGWGWGDALGLMFFSAPSPLLAVSHCILPNAHRARITTPSEELMPSNCGAGEDS